MTEYLEYLYPTHPCGCCNDKNWLELKVRDSWKRSGLPFFSIPFSVIEYKNNQVKCELKNATTPYEQPFWLYFYYTKSFADESSPNPKCSQLTLEKKALAGKLEYRARVVKYDNTRRDGNPFANEDDIFDISNDVNKENNKDIKKYWFKCDRFEEVKVIKAERDDCKAGRVLTLDVLDVDDHFEYLGDLKKADLRCISPHKLKYPIVVTQTTWHQVEQT